MREGEEFFKQMIGANFIPIAVKMTISNRQMDFKDVDNVRTVVKYPLQFAHQPTIIIKIIIIFHHCQKYPSSLLLQQQHCTTNAEFSLPLDNNRLIMPLKTPPPLLSKRSIVLHHQGEATCFMRYENSIIFQLECSLVNTNSDESFIYYVSSFRKPLCGIKNEFFKC